MRGLPNLIPLLALAATGCIEYEILPLWCDGGGACPVALDEEHTSTGDPTGSDPMHMGSAVELLTVGATIGNQHSDRYAVGGAPGDPTNQYANGYVELVRLGVNTGVIYGSPPHDVETAPSGALEFGAALRTADVRNCSVSGSTINHCGEELLVGAPDLNTGSTTGRVFWYSQRSEPQYSGGILDYRGEISPPTGMSNGDGFGASFASWKRPPTYEGWEAAPDVPPWVAIGAPGAETVEIYAVSPASGTPFTHVQTLSVAGYSGQQFGWSLAAGSVDGDSYPDLAVGVPAIGASAPGHVLVFRGVSGTSPLASAPLVLDASTPANGDEFGYSVAMGPVFGNRISQDGVVVGSPGHSSEMGAVCQFALNVDGSAPSGLVNVAGLESCGENESFPYRTSGDRYGHSLAVGSFNPYDAGGRRDSNEALVQEVAVGIPGNSTDRGALVIHPTDDGGIVFDTSFDGAIQLSAPAAGDLLGSSLATGFVQNDRRPQDLLAGAPDADSDYGTLMTTRADLACMEVHGSWMVPDSDGTSREVQILPMPDDTLVLTFIDPFQMTVRDSYGSSGGDICTVDDDGTPENLDYTLPAGSYLVADPDWDCTNSTESWYVSADPIMAVIADALGEEEIPAGEVVELTLTYSTSPEELELDIDMSSLDFDRLGIDDDCRWEGMPADSTAGPYNVCDEVH